MYCKNCGAEYPSPDSVMCVKCGAPKGEGNHFCYNCGHPVDPNAAVCTNCGCSTSAIPSPNAKSKIAAGLLGIFLGGLGVHNFYLGYTGKAVAQLILTLVGSIFGCFVFPLIAAAAAGIWGLVEGIMILAGSIDVDGHNIPLKD